MGIAERMGRGKPTETVADLLFLISILLLSRGVFYSIGVHFDERLLDSGWQFLDPKLLVNELWRSLLYLHSQPPLFNLFVGSILKFFPEQHKVIFHILFIGAGVAITVSTYFLMKSFAIPRGLRLFLIVVFVLSPACILYENWLFYTYPVTATLSVSALVLYRFLNRESMLHGVVFFSLLAGVVLTRSMFQPLWFVAVVFGLFLTHSTLRARILAAASVPFLTVLLWYVKNLIVFGTLTTSSWVGMQTAIKTTQAIPAAEREALAAQSKISRISLIPPFSSADRYLDLLSAEEPTGVAALDSIWKSSGQPNYNHRVYLQVSPIYLKDSLTVLALYPMTWLISSGRSVFIFFQPFGENAYWQPERNSNRRAIAPWERIYNVVPYLRVPGSDEVLPPGQSVARRLVTRLRKISWTLVLSLLISVLFVGGWALRALRKEETRDLGVVALFLVFNVLYVAFVGNALIVGENARLRFLIDPFLVVGLGFLLKRFFTYLKGSETLPGT